MFVNLEDTLHLQRKHFVADNVRHKEAFRKQMETLETT